MTPEFKVDRLHALQDIKDLCVAKVQRLAKSPIGDNSRDLILPEFLETQEGFRWPAVVLYLASDLEQGKSLSDAVAHVSPASKGAANNNVPAKNGRDSAFGDVIAALDVALRDFDANYKPLDAETVRYWQKKHPIEAQHIQYAYKENMRHFMKEAVQELRSELLAIQPTPTIRIAAPKPPKR